MSGEMAQPGRVPRIDVHSHMLEPHVYEVTRPHSVLAHVDLADAPADPTSALARLKAAVFDPAVHVAMLDALKLDAEIVSSTGVMQVTSWAAKDVERTLHQRNNDEIARWVEQHPNRLIGAFTLPLQDRTATLAELERCTQDLGFRVVQLPVNVNGVYLSAPEHRYLWEAIEGLDVVAFMHPDGTLDPWFQQYSMWNSVGQPIEEAKFIASLIYEGILESFARLNLVMAHGGGFLPHYFGRLDRNVVAWPQSAANISRKPSEYLRELYFDTCLYEPAVLEALIARVGADRLVMGSDYPVGELDPVGFVERCPSLSEQEAAAITGGTIAALLGLVATEALGVARAT